MKMKLTLVTLFAVLLLTSFRTQQRTQYCNSRFQFCMEYPQDFRANGESGNGDGQTFTAKTGGAKITAYGSLALDPRDLDESNDPDPLKYQFKQATDGLKLAYKVIKPNYYIFSALNAKGNIVYCKTVKRKIDYLATPGTEVLQTLMIEYPPSEQDKYKDYCTYIAGSLK